jgi:hypothetical protein
MHDDLIHHLDREIEIRANPELVFEHFTDSTRDRRSSRDLEARC